MWFALEGPIGELESIATQHSIRELRSLRKRYGPCRWRKMKGVAKVRLKDATITRAELHWYEAHEIGRRRMKVKHLLEP